MRLSLLMAAIFFHLVSSCKTTSPVARADNKSVPDEDTDESPVSEETQNVETRPATSASLCEALKSENGPGDAVASQIQWLCDRGGFQSLKSRAYGGRGTAAITEYFAEHDKTLYYASGFSLTGSFAKISSIGQMFCGNFEDFRTKVGGHGFESVKSVTVSTSDEESCEYLQEVVPEWGIRADMKALTTFGMIEGQSAMLKVDSMVAPLNYSPLRQFSALLLVWETPARKVEGVYLIKSQVNVSGSLMGATRARLKSTISSTLEGYAIKVRDTRLSPLPK